MIRGHYRLLVHGGGGFSFGLPWGFTIIDDYDATFSFGFTVHFFQKVARTRAVDQTRIQTRNYQ